MIAITCPITCLACGGSIHLDQSVSHAGTETISLVTCLECRREWTVSAQMRPVRQPEAEYRAKYRQKVSA